MYVYIYTHLSIFLHVHIHVRMYICLCVLLFRLIHVYAHEYTRYYFSCHRSPALFLQYEGCTVAVEAQAAAGAGAVFIASAVSAGLAPASGAFGCGFGTAGNLEYSFCHGGEE